MEGKTPFSSLEWIEKHRPKHLDDLAGQGKAISEMREWARRWSLSGSPEKKGLILDGEPGVGKTSAALALASEMGWDVSELNASDARNVDAIRTLVSRGSQSRDIMDEGGFSGSTEPRMKLFILDEADNLHESAAKSGDIDMSDRGGKQAIVELVRMTRHPVILIVNDLYGLTRGSGAALRGLCTTLKFRRLTQVTVAKQLARICAVEGIRHDDSILRSIADRSDGDMRSAVGDLQMVCAGRTRIGVEDISSLGDRDTKESIFKVMERIFHMSSLRESRDALISSDLSPDQLLLWIGENIRSELTHPEDLDLGMYYLSRADIYLGRVKRRQNYKLWGYANDMMASVGIAKRHKRSGFSPYRFPNYLKVMSRTKGSRAELAELSRLLGRLNHTSARSIKEDALYRYREMVVRDPELAANITADANLSLKHLKHLTGGRLSDGELRSIEKNAERIKQEQASPVDLSPSGGLEEYHLEKNDEGKTGTEPEGSVDETGEDETGDRSPSQSTLFQF